MAVIEANEDQGATRQVAVVALNEVLVLQTFVNGAPFDAMRLSADAALALSLSLSSEAAKVRKNQGRDDRALGLGQGVLAS